MAKVTISPARRTELINKVISGQMTIEQAASRYKVPEPFVKKWVEDAGGISAEPTVPAPAPAPTSRPPVSLTTAPPPPGPKPASTPAPNPAPEPPVSPDPTTTTAPSPPAPTPASNPVPDPPVSSDPVTTTAPTPTPSAAPEPTVSSDPVTTTVPAATSKGFFSSNAGLAITALLVIGTVAGGVWFLGRDKPETPGEEAATMEDGVESGTDVPEPDETDGNESNHTGQPAPVEADDNVSASTGNSETPDEPAETDDPASTAVEPGTGEPTAADDDPDTNKPPAPADDDPDTSKPPAPADDHPDTSKPPAPADDDPKTGDDPGTDTPPSAETDSDTSTPDSDTPLPDKGDRPSPDAPKPNVLTVNILNLDTSGDNTKVKASITNHSPLFLSRYYIYLNAHGSDGEFLGRHFLTTANLGPGKTVFDDALIDDVAPTSIQRIVITIDKVESIEDGKAVRRGDDFTVVDVNPDRDLTSLIDITDPPWGVFSKDDSIPTVLVKHLKNFGERYREKQVKMLDVKFLGFTDTYIGALPSVKIDTNGLLVTVNKKEREKWFGISVSDQEGTHFHKVMLPKAVFGDQFLAYKADGSQRLNVIGILVELKDVTGDGLVVAKVEVKSNE